jgi:hypothetical protein
MLDGTPRPLEAIPTLQNVRDSSFNASSHCHLSLICLRDEFCATATRKSPRQNDVKGYSQIGQDPRKKQPEHSIAWVQWLSPWGHPS